HVLQARAGARLEDEGRIRIEQKCKADEPAAQMHQQCIVSARAGFDVHEVIAPATRGRGHKGCSETLVISHGQAKLAEVKPRTICSSRHEAVAALESCRPVLMRIADEW